MATPFGTSKRKSESGTWGSISQLVKENSIPTPPGSRTSTRTRSPLFVSISKKTDSLFKGFWDGDSPKDPFGDLDAAPRSWQKSMAYSGFYGLSSCQARPCPHATVILITSHSSD